MASATPAAGTLGATTEQLVCGASSMVLGEVVAGYSRECRLTAAADVTDCEPKGLATITVRRLDGSPGRDTAPALPDTFEADTSGRLEDGPAEVRYPAPIMTDEDLGHRLIGKRVYVGIWSNPAWRRPWLKLWRTDGVAPAIWRDTCPTSPWRAMPKTG